MTKAIRYGVQIGAVDRPGVKDSDLYNEAIVDAKLTQELGLAQNDPILDRSLVGTPETVARRVNGLRAIGFNYMLISNAMAGVPRDVRHRMMCRFAEEVIPLCEKMPVPERPVLKIRAAE